VKLEQDVLKVVMETLSFMEGEGAVPSVELGLEGLMHAQLRPHKLDPQIGVYCCDLNLFPLEVKM
jgi:hypothetical protein